MRVLAIPDLHCPYQHPQAFDFVSRVAKDFKPDRVVCLGDEIDGYGWSRYRHDPAAMNASAEMKAAVEALQPFFKRFPSVVVCTSNHTERAFKAASSASLPAQWVKSIYEALNAPKGWAWKREEVIDGVYYFHGDGYGGKHAALRAVTENRRSCVIGHVHNYGGISWLPNAIDRIFGMVAGCLIDFNAIAFDYCRHFRSRPTLGCATVEDGKIPQFIPMT